MNHNQNKYTKFVMEREQPEQFSPSTKKIEIDITYICIVFDVLQRVQCTLYTTHTHIVRFQCLLAESVLSVFTLPAKPRTDNIRINQSTHIIIIVQMGIDEAYRAKRLIEMSEVTEQS